MKWSPLLLWISKSCLIIFWTKKLTITFPKWFIYTDFDTSNIIYFFSFWVWKRRDIEHIVCILSLWRWTIPTQFINMLTLSCLQIFRLFTVWYSMRTYLVISYSSGSLINLKKLTVPFFKACNKGTPKLIIKRISTV